MDSKLKYSYLILEYKSTNNLITLLQTQVNVFQLLLVKSVYNLAEEAIGMEGCIISSFLFYLE